MSVQVCSQDLEIVHLMFFGINIGDNIALMQQKSCGTQNKELPASKQSILNSISKYTAVQAHSESTDPVFKK